MSEQAEHLHETLANLLEELEAATDLSEESRKRLHAAVAEIEAKLQEQKGDEPASDEGDDWGGWLGDYARQLETSHPDLVRAIDRVARALSNIGF